MTIASLGMMLCVCLVQNDGNAPAPAPVDSASADVQSLLHATEDSLAEAWDDLEPNLASAPSAVLKRTAESQSIRRDKPAAAAASAGFSWVRTLGSLAAVVALIVLLGWGYRVVAGRGGALGLARPRHPGVIEVLSRTALSPRHSVCLLRVGSRLIMVGASGDRIQALDTFEDAEMAARLSGDAGANRVQSQSKEFRRSLESAERELAAAESELDETNSPEESRLSELRGALESATERLRALRERM